MDGILECTELKSTRGLCARGGGCDGACCTGHHFAADPDTDDASTGEPKLQPASAPTSREGASTYQVM